MIKVKYLIFFLFQLILFLAFFLDNIWRRARIDIPPLLGMSTYRILIVGIVGSQPTGGKNFFVREENLFELNILFIRFGY